MADVESAMKEPLNPAVVQSPELRWGLIRKIYSILIIQFLLTIAFASVAISFVSPLTTFFNTTAGLIIFIAFVVFTFLVLWPLNHYRQRHPVNLVLLAIFTVCISLVVGLACAITGGKVILEAVIILLVVVVSLTIYTFWAAKKGSTLGFQQPFLISSVIALAVFGIIQVFFPLGKITTMVYGGVAALILCAFIVADTDILVERYTYDEYAWAYAVMYLDVLKIFIYLLNIFGSIRRCFVRDS